LLNSSVLARAVQNAFGWQAACGLDVTYFDQRAQAAERGFLGLSG
jgi:hypothetical protein